MKKNYSPWIHQLNRQREEVKVSSNIKTDIVIIGGGIAGVSTAYYILKNTKENVILLDANKVGHGASGHNAGQLTTYFERPLSDIASEFGVDMACTGQKNIESAWGLLEEIGQDVKLETQIHRFTGYAGMSTLQQVLLHLTDNMIRYDGGITVERMLISDTFEYLDQIPSVYSHLFEVSSHQNILNLLETNNTEYIATLAYRKGVTNSARICEEIITHLLDNYPNRFEVFENSPINRIFLKEESVKLEILFKKEEMLVDGFNHADFILESKKVILCTNGFEGFDIINNFGEEVNTRFHNNINGRVNYMSAYLDNISEDPVAISYFSKDSLIDANKGTITGEQYFYITRRPHVKDGVEMGLISTGGPENILKVGEIYNRGDTCEEWAERDIDNFLKKNYQKHKGEKVVYDFCWHGLLGYTNSGIRMIGAEPKNKNLIYNLGCNGVGIMPSIYGSKKVSQIINGEVLPKSIFDIK
jgi:hypothetical protein